MKMLIAVAAAMVLGTSSVFAADLSGKSWDEIVDQAKKEGELTWYVWYLQDDFRNAVKGFEEKYGIKVNIPEGTNQVNSDKLLAERSREVGDIDVHAWGFNEYETNDPSQLYMSLDMLPEDSGRRYELLGVDSKGHAVAYWGNQTGIAYDPAKVSEADLPQSPEELAAFWTENKGKFGFNFEKGGSGPSFYHNVIRSITGLPMTDGEVTDEKMAKLNMGIDFFNEHADNYVVTASNSDTITRISDGELWMGPGWEDHVAGLQKKGEVRKDIKFYVPAFGMNGGGNGVGIPKNAPHPAAAAVFVDWLASAETQSMFNKEFGTAPMNAAADDSYALVPTEQRQYQVAWPLKPFRTEMENTFIEEVILER